MRLTCPACRSTNDYSESDVTPSSRHLRDTLDSLVRCRACSYSFPLKEDPVTEVSRDAPLPWMTPLSAPSAVPATKAAALDPLAHALALLRAPSTPGDLTTLQELAYARDLVLVHVVERIADLDHKLDRILAALGRIR